MVCHAAGADFGDSGESRVSKKVRRVVMARRTPDSCDEQPRLTPRNLPLSAVLHRFDLELPLRPCRFSFERFVATRSNSRTSLLRLWRSGCFQPICTIIRGDIFPKAFRHQYL